MQTNHEFVILTEKTVSSSPRFRASAGNPQHKGKSSQELHTDRDGILLAHRAAQRENEALSRLSESETDTRFFFEEHRNQLLRGKI